MAFMTKTQLLTAVAAILSSSEHSVISFAGLLGSVGISSTANALSVMSSAGYLSHRRAKDISRIHEIANKVMDNSDRVKQIDEQFLRNEPLPAIAATLVEGLKDSLRETGGGPAHPNASGQQKNSTRKMLIQMLNDLLEEERYNIYSIVLFLQFEKDDLISNRKNFASGQFEPNKLCPVDQLPAARGFWPEIEQKIKDNFGAAIGSSAVEKCQTRKCIYETVLGAPEREIKEYIALCDASLEVKQKLTRMTQEWFYGVMKEPQLEEIRKWFLKNALLKSAK